MRMTDAPIRVHAEYDDEARVWIAESEDVPGLVAENADLSVLSDMVAELVPLLLVENRMIPDGEVPELPIEITATASIARKARVLA